MLIKLFTKKDCPRCPAAKKLIDELKIKKLKLKIETHNVVTIDGMAEAAFYTVMGTPTILLCTDAGKEIVGWRGTVPSLEELLLKIR